MPAIVVSVSRSAIRVHTSSPRGTMPVAPTRTRVGKSPGCSTAAVATTCAPSEVPTPMAQSRPSLGQQADGQLSEDRHRVAEVASLCCKAVTRQVDSDSPDAWWQAAQG